jgi:hypothetical protein
MEYTRVDLRPVNEYTRFRRARIGFISFAAVCGAMAVIGVWGVAYSGRSFASGPGPLYFEIAVTTFAAAMLTLLAIVTGMPLAVELQSGDSGLEFVYPTGRIRRFNWRDPALRIVFLDYVRRPPSETAGLRITCLWMPFVDRTHIPPDLFDKICAAVPRFGVSIQRVAHPPTGGERVVMTSVPSTVPKPGA